MVMRDVGTDAGRKGAPGTRSVGTRDVGTDMQPCATKGKWLMAYSGTRGMTATEADPDFGTAENEVGNDYDGDYDDRARGI